MDEKQRDMLLRLASSIAKSLLSRSLVADNGGFTTSFGPVTHGFLVDLATNGNPDGFCDREKHIFNECNRCTICGYIE